jgi:cyclase
MLNTRTIPVLLLRNGGLVKTIQFDGAKYIGDPINAVKIFNEKEVDEIVVLDISASKEKLGPNFNLLSSLASECFMPLGYGGGIRNLEDIKRLFMIGVEKVILNTILLTNLDIVREAVEIFGSQSVVASVDIKKNIWGSFQIYSHNKAIIKYDNYLNYIKKLEEIGCGEIILNSVDLDGTMNGYDLNLINTVSINSKIPVVAVGGAGSLSDFVKAKKAGASAVAAGSLFIYHGINKGVLINYPSQKELKALYKND